MPADRRRQILAVARATVRLVEAARSVAQAAAGRAEQAAHARKLANELRTVFRRQQKPVLAALAKHRSLFSEADAGLPSPGSYAWLLAALAGGEASIRRALGLVLPDALKAAARRILGRVGIKFDLANPRAEAYMKQALNRSSRINQTTFEIIRDMLTKGIRDGRSYQDMAKAIRDKFKEFARPASQRHIRDRAELVAVTEIGDAYSQGTLVAAQQMADRGLRMEKAWLTVGDDRVEQECQGNEAEGWIPLERPFSSGDQRPLAHPGCRCALLTRVAV